jgi:hypothetical protein
MKTILIAFLSIIFSFWVSAQNKSALIIGINNYYKARNKIDGAHSLQGSVNDAKAVKAMLITRFGFEKDNFTELYDEQASKANIIRSLYRLSHDCHPGDIIFIFYAGHGMLLDNSFSTKDGGKNQGILASDLYSPSTSLIRDNELKRYVNEMITRKAVVTVINDCCYSGGNCKEGWAGKYLADVRPIEEPGRRRAIDIDEDIPEIKAISSIDRADEIRQDPIDFANTSRFIPHTGQDIKDKTFVRRPEDIPNSRFLFLAATTGVQQSKERVDISNLKHGVFTTALISVIKRSKPNITARNLLVEISKELNNQYIDTTMQQPEMYGDPSRYDMNLVGGNPTTFSPSTKVRVLSIVGNAFMLSGGAPAGLTKGNLLKEVGNGDNTILEVTAVNQTESATAILKQGNKRNVRVGDEFEVTDWYTVSTPRLKIFIPQHPVDLLYFNQVLSKIKPVLAYPSFRDYGQKVSNNNTSFYFYNNKMFAEATTNGSFNNRKSIDTRNVTAKTFAANRVTTETFSIYLPIPKELYNAIREKSSSNQNIEFVSDPALADLGLYCGINKSTGQLNFQFSKEIIGNKINSYQHMTEADSFHYDKNKLDHSSINLLADTLVTTVLKRASFFGWLNNAAKRKTL